jgi:hypothetical protein
VRLEGLGQLKKSNDLIGNRTSDLPACSIVPQPTTLPRAPDYVVCKAQIECMVVMQELLKFIKCILMLTLNLRAKSLSRRLF